jgi:hypothetical protein
MEEGLPTGQTFVGWMMDTVRRVGWDRVAAPDGVELTMDTARRLGWDWVAAPDPVG